MRLMQRIADVFPGRVLEGLKLQHPFQERRVPVILGRSRGARCRHRRRAHRAGSRSR